MAQVPSYLRGITPVELNGTSLTAYRLGNTVSWTTPTASTNHNLPVDPSGNAYANYLVTASGWIWVAFADSGGFTIVAGAANAYLVGPGVALLVQAPIQGSTNVAQGTPATSLSAIFDAASTAGSVMVAGLY